MKYTKSILIAALAALSFTSCDQNEVDDIETSESTIETTFSDAITSQDVATIVDNISVQYPITVINDDTTPENITSDEGLKEYGQKSKKPKIEFPIDVVVDGETLTINSAKEIKELIGKRIGNKPPPLNLVFPVTVINADETTTEIADKEAMKAYVETLEKGTKPAFQFPFSITKKDGNIVSIESEEDFKVNRPNKKGAKKPKRRPLNLVFPVTVINADETTTEIADKEAMKTYVETLEEGTKPTFQFPVSITQKDETIVSYNSEEELKADRKK